MYSFKLQNEARASTTLGSLFKVTEVHLWANPSTEKRERDRTSSVYMGVKKDSINESNEETGSNSDDSTSSSLSCQSEEGDQETRSSSCYKKPIYSCAMESKICDGLLGNKFSETLNQFEIVADNFSNPMPIFPSKFNIGHLSENKIKKYSDQNSLYSSSNTHEFMKSSRNKFGNSGFGEVCSRDVYVPKENWNSNVPLRSVDSVSTKQKDKARRMQPKENGALKTRKALEKFSPNVRKYWNQRYELFSRFDEGIEMDGEGWFSVTPEVIAKHHARRCSTRAIIDCFTGVGGNAIQFAKSCKHVTAIDINPKRIEYAKHNAAIYGVEDRIQFITGDCFRLAPTLTADIVFLSPPWGGPEYAKVKTFDLKMLEPRDGYYLFHVAKRIAPRVVMFLPRNIDLNQLAELCLSSNPPWSLEVEKNFLNGKFKAITAYFTDPFLKKSSNRRNEGHFGY